MKQFYTTLMSVCLAMLLGGSLFAAEYHVNLDGSGDFAVIQDAIDAAQDGDVIIVHPGTYYENIHFLGKNIVLHSTDIWDRDVVEATVIDGQQLGSVVTFAGTEDDTCELSGFTITNGFAEDGGGIYGGYFPSARAVLSHCIITQNTAETGGGGVYSLDGEIRSCIISENNAGYYGGGADLGSGLVAGCIISGNTSGFGGGGISSGEATITNCVISDNRAQRRGGGIDNAKNCRIVGCVISRNSAGDDFAGYGGGVGILCEGTLENCLITENFATDHGGGFESLRSATLINCTIWGNSSPRSGAAFFDSQSSVIRNCIIWGNYADNGDDLYSDHDAGEFGEMFDVSYSCVQDWEGGVENISCDPGFADAPGGDFRLQPDSPCINAGDDSAVTEELELDGLPRLINRAVDMGPYEYPDGCHIEVSNDREQYFGHETVTVGVKLTNFGSARTVDLHAGILNYKGELIFSPSASDEPWLSGVTVDADSQWGPEHFTYQFTTDELGDVLTAYAIATEHGSQSALSNRATSEFGYRRGFPRGFAVKPGGDFATIQEGIDAAQDGDTIIVDPGTYYENIHFKGKNIVLTSTDIWDRDVVEATVIDGQQLGSVVTFAGTEDETCELSGFTITNGWAIHGGGICGALWVPRLSGRMRRGPLTEASIANCIVKNNVALEGGGGLFCCAGRISGCRFIGNANGSDADEYEFLLGSAIFISGKCYSDTVRYYDVTVRFEDCEVMGNELNYAPHVDSPSGAIYLQYCSAELTSCDIIGNSSEDGLGGEGCSLVISDCTVSENSRRGIYVLSESSEVENSTISYNGRGGIHSGGTVTNCVVEGNGGPGVEIWGNVTDCLIQNNSGPGIVSGVGYSTIENCEIIGNRSTNNEGGGIRWGGEGTIENCRILDNSAPEGGGLGFSGVHPGDGLEVRDCVIAGNSARRGGAIATGGGNLALLTLLNCTIVNNSALTGGWPYKASIDAGFFGHESRLSLYNCILWNSANEVEVSPAIVPNATVIYTCVRGGYEGEGNIDADPLFVSGPYGDYYLSHVDAGQDADSPCIDIGSMSALEAGLADKTTRTDGVPDCGTVDVGYHYAADLTISAFLNRDEFCPADIIEGSIAVENNGPDSLADLYIAFVFPDGSVLSFVNSGFVEGVSPWLAGIFLPSGFSFGPEVIFELQVPDSIVPGEYLFAAALTSPGAISPISFSATEFEIR